MSEKPPVLIDIKFNPEGIAEALTTAFPDRGFINLADPANAGRDLTNVEYAVLWKPDDDLFARAPNLKAIYSAGAGVDGILALDNLPDVPLVRFVDHSLTTRMSEWVVLQCLSHLREVAAHERHSRERLWGKLIAPQAAEVTVGIMGLGVLGLDAATKLKVMGFNVIGWSRSAKHIEGLETFDAGQIDNFLGRTDILVGLLPLTAATTGLYDKTLFSKLRQGGALGKPVFVNSGRGKSQVHADVIEALKTGVLGGASIDVFEVEPLPADDPMWDLENVFITPHDAAVSEQNALFRHVETEIARFERGEPLQYLVDRTIGY